MVKFLSQFFKEENHLSIKGKTLAFYIVILLLLNLVFFIFMQPTMYENGVYFKYLQSIVHDGDFNIFNQFNNSFDRWMVTTSYNHPDYHSPFTASLLLLPFIFIKSFLPIPISDNFLGMPIFFSLALLPVILLQGYFIAEAEEDKKFKRIFYLTSLTISTLWQVFADPSELSAICLIFSLIIFFEFKDSLFKDQHSIVLLCFTTAFFSLVRADGIFYGVAICILYILLKQWKKTALIATSLLLGLGQFFLINQIRFGTLTVKNPVTTLDHFYLIPYLFGPNGLFIKSPFLFVTLCLLIFQIITNKDNRNKIILGLGLIVILFKFLALNFNICPVTNYLPSRHYIVELPFFSYALYLTFKDRLKLMVAAIIPFILYCFYDLAGYFSYLDETYKYFFHRFVNWNVFKMSHDKMILFAEERTHFFNEHLTEIIVLSVINALFFTTLYWLHAHNPKKFRSILIIGLALITITFSGLNLVNNQKNARAMDAQNLFEKAVVAKGDAVYYDEVLDMLDVITTSSEEYGLPEKQSILNFQKSYIDSVEMNITHDPIGFRNDLKNGINRKSFWQFKKNWNKDGVDRIY